MATDPQFEKYEIQNQLRNTIVSRFADVVGQSKIPVLELAGNYERLSQLALDRIAPDLMKMGIGLTAFYIENISLPPEVEKALDTRTSMGVIGDMNQFTRYKTAEAIQDAANNPGGVAGVGAGLGAGFAVAGQMAGAVAQQAQQPTAQAVPPPLPQSASFFVAFNGQQTGPFDMNTIQAKVRDGSLTRSTLVWKQGMSNWAAAESVPELAALFASVPPPLPPQS
ncbi:MAG: hypothetical protein KatS3mg105_4381 [Gemmatales bacterium]|nr:MAG: hypothetical protein KatS3mg105_4381 [Gemmatales bacterium]